jgi:hypothetical protein
MMITPSRAARVERGEINYVEINGLKRITDAEVDRLRALFGSKPPAVSDTLHAKSLARCRTCQRVATGLMDLNAQVGECCPILGPEVCCRRETENWRSSPRWPWPCCSIRSYPT